MLALQKALNPASTRMLEQIVGGPLIKEMRRPTGPIGALDAVGRIDQPALNLQKVIREMAKPIGLNRALGQINRLQAADYLRLQGFEPTTGDLLARVAKPSPALQKTIDAMARPAGIQAFQRILQTTYRWPEIVNASRALAAEYTLDPEAIERFESLDAETGEDDAPLWAWLLSLSAEKQLPLLLASLDVLDRLSRVIGDVTSVERPKGVESSIQLLLTVACFLLIWLQEQAKEDD